MWHNSARMTTCLQESYLDRTWGSAECAALISEDVKCFLMQVWGDFYNTWILWLDHQSFHQLTHVGRAIGQSTELVGDVHAAPVPQGMSGRSVDSPRTSQEGAYKITSSSHISQRQAIHLAYEISDQYSICLSNYGTVCWGGSNFPLQDFCSDRLELFWSIVELKGLYPFWITFVARREKGHS